MRALCRPSVIFAVSISVASACRTPNAQRSGAVKDDAPTETPVAALPSDADADRIYDSVRSVLAVKHAAAQAQTWELTTGALEGEWLMQSPDASVWGAASAALPYGTPCTGGGDCDNDFRLNRCTDAAECADGDTCKTVAASVKKPGDQPVKLCVGSGDFIYDRIYNLIIKAQKSVDIVSLSPPDGRYKAAMVNALVYLDHAGVKPDVRLLFGGEDSTKPTLHGPKKYLGDWMKDLTARKSDFGLTVSCAWLSHLGSWNHTKIITVDGTDAIVGSMNFWEKVYLQPDPVFDMSLYVTGPAALAATRFADTLWNAKPISIGTLPAGKAPLMNHAVAGDAATLPPAGAAKIIGVGRLGGFGNNAADDAISALFASAKTSIKISQQDLYRLLSNSGPFGNDALIDAVLRGVDVQVIKSSVVSKMGYGMYSTADTFDYLARAVEKKAKKYAKKIPKGSYQRTVCEKLHFAPLRYSAANPPDGQVKSHTKLIMIDDAAFYVGSQNLYEANLQEYGYIIFDKALAATMIATYWDPAWKHSSESMIPCNPVD